MLAKAFKKKWLITLIKNGRLHYGAKLKLAIEIKIHRL